MKTITMLLSMALIASLSITGCSGGSSKKENKLTSGKWQLETLNGVKITLPEGGIVTLEINTDEGRVSGKAPCNTYSCSYDQYNSQLKFNAITSTKMACGDMGKEIEYYDMLGKVNEFKISSNNLTLLSEGKVIAEFKKTQ